MWQKSRHVLLKRCKLKKHLTWSVSALRFVFLFYHLSFSFFSYRTVESAHQNSPQATYHSHHKKLPTSTFPIAQTSIIFSVRKQAEAWNQWITWIHLHATFQIATSVVTLCKFCEIKWGVAMLTCSRQRIFFFI